MILAITILMSSIIVPYNNSISIVYAENEDNIAEFVTALVGAVLGIVGLTASGGIGLVISGIGITLDAFAIGSYISDNGDGTITINSEGIQLIIDEYERYASSLGFSENDLHNLELHGSSYTYRYAFNSHGYNGSMSWDNTGYCNFKTSNKNIAGNLTFNDNGTKTFTVSCGTTYMTFNNSKLTSIRSTGQTIITTYQSNTVSTQDASGNNESTLNVNGNFPIFDNYESYQKYVNNGTDYTSAINYVENKPHLRYGSNYTPKYSGGNVTVNKNKLPYVIKKIDNLNKQYPDDTDAVINNFITWVYSDDDEPETETETPIEPDTSEVGDDLTETNGWLQKIYNRIGEFMNSFNSQKNKLNNLLESKFDELITAVKNIGKSDEPEIEPETETETETETSTDKADIIIENQEKSQGILESILTAIQDGFKDTVDELKKIRRWTALDTIFDGLDAVADWLDFVTKFFDNVTDGIGLLVSGFTDTVTELTKVFPFSIPITLVLIVQMFSAPPEPPKFELPLKLDAFNIDEKIVIDLSQFQVISVISRTFLTIIYCVGLYHLTFKIITAKKGG